MGFDPTNNHGTYLRFSPTGWALALSLVETYEWHPEGTTLPGADDEDENEWSGEYATNDGQRVSAIDACLLADACERALDDPGYIERAMDVLAEINAAIVEAVPDATRAPATPEKVQQFRDRLRELIAFCREGGFTIE